MKIDESIIMFKPDARDIKVLNREGGVALLHELGASALAACGLVVTDYIHKTLSANDVRNIYAKVLAPNPEDDAIWGTAWKDKVIAHLTSAPVDAYLIQDPHGIGIERVRDLKNLFRQQYERTGNVVQNIAHVPDQDELDTTRRVLFGYE